MGWISDIGSAVGDFFEEAGSAFGGLFDGLISLANLAVNFIKELLNRGLGILDFVLTLLGILLPKKMRITAIILRDEKGKELATESDVMPSINLAIRVFKDEMNVKLMSANPKFVTTLLNLPPKSALDVRCDDGGALADDLGLEGKFFRSAAVSNISGTLFGYAAPVTIFIVRDVEGKKGCSLSAFANYVTVDIAGLKTSRTEPQATTAAHELGHSCFLFHRSPKSNLMYPDSDRDTDLTNWQKAVFRGSRHVTFL